MIRRSLKLAACLLALVLLGSCSMFDYSGMMVHKYALVYGVTTLHSSRNADAGPNL